MKNYLFNAIIILLAMFMLCSCGNAEYVSVLPPETSADLTFDEQSNIINCQDIPHWFYTDNLNLMLSESSQDELRSYKDSCLNDNNGNVYSVYKEGVCINWCTLSEESTTFRNIIEIPQTIHGKNVIKIGGYFGFFDPDSYFPATHFNYLQYIWISGDVIIDKINIPKYVKEISWGNFYGRVQQNGELVMAVKEIIVDEENEYYSAQDGVLFNKDKTSLLFYPEAKKGRSYTVPDSVTTIEIMNFSNTKLKEITIGENVSKINATFSKNTVIKGYSDTVAEEYAKENGLKFKAIE